MSGSWQSVLDQIALGYPDLCHGLFVQCLQRAQHFKMRGGKVTAFKGLDHNATIVVRAHQEPVVVPFLAGLGNRLDQGPDRRRQQREGDCPAIHQSTPATCIDERPHVFKNTAEFGALAAAGVVSDIDDSDSLASTAMALAGAPERLAKIGAAGRAHAHETGKRPANAASLCLDLMRGSAPTP